MFLILAAAFWWLLFFRFGNSPRFSRLFLWAESPLIIQISPEISQSFKSEKTGSISLDEYGVPSISANNETDAAYFLGWMHGKERRFQMEMIRRTVQGTLCEIVGKKAISSDLFWRKFQFSKKWRTWYAQQPQELKDYFLAYSQGVNDQWKQQSQSEKPIEFFLMDFDPQEFQPQDLYYLLRYMDYSLNYDESELAWISTKKQLPTEVFDFFYNTKSKIEHPILSNSIEVKKASPSQLLFPNKISKTEIKTRNWMEAAGQTEVGSNNWAVGKNKLSGIRSALSNDPHLKLQLPNTWYEVNIKTPKGNKAGFTLPGSPFIISGNNDSIAWGITNATWTLTHFFPIKQISSHKILLNQSLLSTQLETETIEIRGEKPLQITVQRCRYGIIDTIGGQSYLVQWVGNASIQESNEALTFWGLEHGKNLTDVEKSIKYYGHPPQNFVFADHLGNVLQATCGFLGDFLPSEPVKWEKAQNQLWEKNPNRGFVFSANQAQSSHLGIHQLSNSFAPEARAKGIKNALVQESISTQNLLALQTRLVDEEWDSFRKKFIFYVPNGYLGLKKDLACWDGKMEENSVSAAFFSVVRYFLHRELIKNCLGKVDFQPHSDRLNEILQKLETVSGKNMPIEVSKIWEKGMILGIDSLVRIHGKNWRNWTYGKTHRAEIQHITKIPALGLGTWAFNGSERSVNVLRIGRSIHGASMRNTVVFTDQGFIRYSINFGGQSGRCFSPHYSDQIQPWKNGFYRKQNGSTFKAVHVYEFHP